jgi:allantoin racemase
VKIANIVSPGAEYLVPAVDDLADGARYENIVTKVDVPIAVDPLRLALKDLVYVEAAVRAERSGCDAVFVNTVADYGVELMRSAVGIPVRGAGEASIAAAAALGTNFSIVTVWPSSTRIYYDRVLRAAGATGRCASIRHVLEETELGGLGGGRGVMAEVTHPGSAVAERVLHASKESAASDHADVIILGCTCMAGLTEFLQRNLEIPVVNPLRAGYLAAQADARTARPGPNANPDTVARVLAAVDAMTPMGASAPQLWAKAETGDCGDVCASIA